MKNTKHLQGRKGQPVRQMFTWNKHGIVFEPTKINNISWMKEFAQSPSALVYENFVRVYFCCRPPADSNGQYISYIGYVDLDRLNLFRILNVSKVPVLEMGELGTFDEFGTNPVSVIRFENQVWLYYCGWTRCESVPVNAAIGVAISHDDGETFKRLGNGPVLSYSPDEPFELGSPRIRRFNGLWYLWYAAGKKWVDSEPRPEAVYKIRMAISENGIDWSKCGVDLIKNKIEENECQASPEVFQYHGKYHMFFSYRYNLDFRRKGRGYRIGYAVSDDLYSWSRNDEMAGIDISESGWDSDMVSYPNILEMDNNVYMFYQGNELGKNGFGLAKLLAYNG